MKQKKKRSPQDATLRNVRAANRRIAALEKRVAALEYGAREFAKWVTEVERNKIILSPQGVLYDE